MNENAIESSDRIVGATQVIVAAALHVTDAVYRDGVLRTVTSLRVQGVPPQVCVELAGLSGRYHYLATARVQVVRGMR